MKERESWPGEGTGFKPSAEAAPSHENVVKRVGATVGFLADASRRRPGGRRVLWVMIMGLATVGFALMAYPFYTGFIADRVQDSKTREFASEELRQAYIRDVKSFKEGAAVTKLLIPKLDVDIIVVEGASGNALRAGAGHYPESALPGDVGNVAIFGHRTGFGQPFRNIDKLKAGDLIILETPIGKYTYRVMPPFDGHPNPWITHPLDWSPTAPTPTPVITLITCDPPHTSKMRLMLRAELVDSEEVA